MSGIWCEATVGFTVPHRSDSGAGEVARTPREDIIILGNKTLSVHSCLHGSHGIGELPRSSTIDAFEYWSVAMPLAGNHPCLAHNALTCTWFASTTPPCVLLIEMPLPQLRPCIPVHPWAPHPSRSICTCAPQCYCSPSFEKEEQHHNVLSMWICYRAYTLWRVYNLYDIVYITNDTTAIVYA